MSWDERWVHRAACLGSNPEELFVDATGQKSAKEICAGCRVRAECLACALDERIQFGVWGGMTVRERRQLLRRRPDVASWRSFLEMARDAHDTDRRDVSAARR